MSCNICNSNPSWLTNKDKCGCQVQLGTECIFYKDSKLNCLNVNKGESLESIIQKIDSILCELNPESAPCYNVLGTTNQIVVTPNSSNNCNNFVVSLSPTITNLLSTHTSQISTLNTEVSTKLCDIETNTPEFVDISKQGCIVTINFNPSGYPTQKGGIVLNHLATVSADNTVPSGEELLVFNYNYNLQDISIGDQIEVEMLGTIGATEFDGDSFGINFYNSNNSGSPKHIVRTTGVGGNYICLYKVLIDVISSTQALFTSFAQLGSGSINSSSASNTFQNSTLQGEFVSGLTFDNFTIAPTVFLNDTQSSNTALHKLTVKVTKKV